MSYLSTKEYSSSTPAEKPRLYSATRDFHFLSGDGRVVHQSLPIGPDGYRVFAITSTGHEASVVEQSRIALTVPVKGTAEVSIDGREAVVRPGDIVAIGPSPRHSRMLPLSASTFYKCFIVISPPQAVCPHLDQESWLIRRSYPDHQQFKHLLDLAFEITGSGKAASDSTVASLETLIEDMFWAALTPQNGGGASSLSQNGSRFVRRANEYARVRKAEEYMRANLSRSLSVAQIAAAVGISVRGLQLAFRLVRDATPHAVLNNMRLEQARGLLQTRAGAGSVTTVAFDCGFTHLGRFASAYRSRFGESPRETLGKSTR